MLKNIMKKALAMMPPCTSRMVTCIHILQLNTVSCQTKLPKKRAICVDM